MCGNSSSDRIKKSASEGSLQYATSGCTLKLIAISTYRNNPHCDSSILYLSTAIQRWSMIYPRWISEMGGCVMIRKIQCTVIIILSRWRGHFDAGREFKYLSPQDKSESTKEWGITEMLKILKPHGKIIVKKDWVLIISATRAYSEIDIRWNIRLEECSM